jgi:hypothetical protein
MGILYDLYMEDYMLEATAEMNKYLGKEFDEATDKSKVYKENYYLRDNLQIPYVSQVLAKRKNRDAMVMFVGKFLDDHAMHLSTSGPVHMFMFGDKETNFLYELFNVNAEQLLDMYDNMINEAFFGKISSFISGWVRNAPHKILITAILIEALQKNYSDIVECCEYLWAFSEYPIIYRMFWKTGVKEDVMTYTIEHLGSKFKVKKVANLQALLKYDANSAINFMSERLLTGADHTYTDLMQRMRNQIKNTFVNIAKAYYANDKEDASHHTNVSSFDDGTLADQEGHITNIAQSVDRTIGRFSIGEINTSIARISADGSQVDKDNLIGYLNQIISAKNNNLNKFIENIITSYFNKNPTDTSLGSSEFLNFALAMYRSIGTSKDSMYQEVKSILSMWMNDIINIRQFYSREATIISYTRAIYNYMVFMINHYN